MRHRRTVWALVLCTGFLAWFAVDVLLRLAPESSPVARGGATPDVYGCLGCHGRSDDALPNEWALSCARTATNDAHPAYDGNCEDLLAFFAMARVRSTYPDRLAASPSNRLLAGEHLARRFYCFQCHGELGQGGFPNNGSLKGYVPGYFGKDFRALTNDASPDAVKAWMLRGTNPELLDRFIEGPIAAFFFERQAIQMPEFDSLSEDELQLLIDYVLAIQALGPMTAATVREYDRLTRLPPLPNVAVTDVAAIR